MARERSYWFEPADPTDPRRWALPAAHGQYDDLELEYLDVDDEDDRAVLIEAEHADWLQDVRRRSQGSDDVSPEAHLALHQVVANRLWDADRGGETWLTAQRLSGLGYERHVVLHMLMSVVSEEMFRAVRQEPLLSPDEVTRRLDALPNSWPPPERANAH